MLTGRREPAGSLATAVVFYGCRTTAVLAARGRAPRSCEVPRMIARARPREVSSYHTRARSTRDYLDNPRIVPRTNPPWTESCIDALLRVHSWSESRNVSCHCLSEQVGMFLPLYYVFTIYFNPIFTTPLLNVVLHYHPLLLAIASRALRCTCLVMRCVARLFANISSTVELCSAARKSALRF